MSEEDKNNNETNKNNLYYLNMIDIQNINKLLPSGYKLVDENDKDIRIFLKQKKIQDKKLKKKKLHQIHIKPGAYIDKRKLSDNIRGLPEDQLKGIINLIDKKTEVVEKNGFFELDIEKLSQEKLYKLDKYVKSCMKSSGYTIPTRYQDEFKKKNENNNEIEDITKMEKTDENKNLE